MTAIPVYSDILCSLGILSNRGTPEEKLHELEEHVCPSPDRGGRLQGFARIGDNLSMIRASPSVRTGSPQDPQFRSNGFLAAVGDVVLLNRGEIAALLDASRECTDDELLLGLYARFGAMGMNRVRGMFALAIWDGKAVTLVSDSIGARSVFYTRAKGTWAVSSSLQALRKWKRLHVAINYAAVRSFLSCGYLLGDETLLKGVYKLPPASCIVLRPGGSSELSSYWEPSEGPWDPTDPPEAYASHLMNLLEEATSLCLPKNEEVGVFLSGGLDSSLVAALACRLHEKPVRTFTINFGSDFPNELSYADEVARQCGTKHAVLTYDGSQVVDRFQDTIALMDCPVGEGLTVPNLLLSQAAADEGLSVILNGEGGDPCFGGPKNMPMLLFELHRTDPSPNARARAYLAAHRHCYDDLASLLNANVQREMLSGPSAESRLSWYLESERMSSYLNRLMWTNLRLKGPGYMLTKVDYLVASTGIQGRYPLFDRQIVEYSFMIPPRYKLAGTEEKWILKCVARDMLPDSILERPKSGMRMPMKHWLTGPIRQLAERLLLDGRGRSRGLFNTAVIRAWLNGRGASAQRCGQRLWLALTLEAWLQAYVD